MSGLLRERGVHILIVSGRLTRRSVWLRMELAVLDIRWCIRIGWSICDFCLLRVRILDTDSPVHYLTYILDVAALGFFVTLGYAIEDDQ